MFQILINIICSAFLLLLIALSFSVFTYYPTKYFQLAHAAIISLGAYFYYFLFHQLNYSIWFAVIVAIFLSILIGLFIEIFIFKLLRKKHTSPLLLLIVSLGVYVVLQNCISLIWGDDTKSVRTGEVKVGNEIMGAYITDIQIITIVVSVTLFTASLIFLKYNKLGRNIRAVAANAELANIMGINSNLVIFWSFVIGCGMAAIAGILVASDTGLTPTMGFNLLLYGIVVMIIGGVGSTKWLIGSAFLLATAQNLTAFYIDSKWMDAITYVILILFLIWKPLGFSGKRLKKTEI